MPLTVSEQIALVQVLASIFSIIGIFFIIFGAGVIATGFMGETGFQRGWSSRKKQGLIMCVAGAVLWSISQFESAINQLGVHACKGLPFVGTWAPAVGLAAIACGIAQIALHFISDKFGDRITGIRMIIGGAMIAQVGPVIDFLLPQLIP